jgi:ABC-type cobalt transport system substrate-binding protein
MMIAISIVVVMKVMSKMVVLMSIEYGGSDEYEGSGA